MAFVAEPVVGASLGTQPVALDTSNAFARFVTPMASLFIADEVMCGMGRTGSLFALEQEGIAADITTLAKGLGAGYQPIAAVMAAENVIRTIKDGSGTLWNGHTYMSHAIATAGALAVQKVIEEKTCCQMSTDVASSCARACKPGSVKPSCWRYSRTWSFLDCRISSGPCNQTAV